MRCPLIVLESNKSLTAIFNGKMEEFPNPFKPYVLCRPEFATDMNAPTQRYTDLFTKEPVDLVREEFEDMTEAAEFYKATGRRGMYFNSIKDQILLDHPDYFRQFAQTDPVK